MSLVVPRSMQRSVRADEAYAIESARAQLLQLAEELGHDDLSSLAVLDVGCGVKFSQVLINDGLGIGRYAGVDVHRPLIDFLTEHVHDERFEYHHVDFYNERYNPAGSKMTEASELPVSRGSFDVICLYSVFTHLDPADYSSMLKVIRPHVKPAGHAIYSLFLDQLSSTGLGFMDAFARRTGPEWVGTTDRYQDFTPDDPLRQAMYTEEYAKELIDGTGWRLERVIEPTKYVQYQFLLTPVNDSSPC